MLPIWRAFVPLLFFAATGAVLDRVLALDLGASGSRPGRWARWAMCGIVACFAAALHPAVLGALIALALVGRLARKRPTGGPRLATPPSRSAPRSPPWWGIAAAALTLVVVCRPATLTYWDGFVWLAKAKIESGAWGALRAAALDQSTDVVPSGYPLLWPLAASWLSMSGRTMEALAAGAAAMTLVTLMLFLDTAADAAGVARASGATAGPGASRGLAGALGEPRWAALGLALVGVTPLVFVHLRSSYADLPVGLLAATCTLRLVRSVESDGDSPGDLSVAAMTAVALAGIKDEGMAHVVALVVALIAVKVWKLWEGQRLPLAPGIAVLAAAAIPFNGWRLLLASHRVIDADHSLSRPDLHAAGAIGRAVLAHLADTRSWGALWPIAFACATLVLARSNTFRAATRMATFAFLAEGALLLSAIVCGPARVRVFAFEGTLINRLLLQLAPAAGVMLMLALADAAMAWQTVRRPGTTPLAVPASPAPVPVLTRSSD
jgi:hypothetical protein